MSGALEKNVQAVGEIAGGLEVGDLAGTARIGVWCGGRPEGAEAAARLTAEALGDLLGRFWCNIDAEGDAAAELESAAAPTRRARAASPAPRVRRKSRA